MAASRRNIAVMAHVDTGKTTLTEHLLFRTGAIRSRGSVDEGTAFSDRMSVERARGISVESTPVTLTWKDTELHLIDTPGHADFAAQVERAMWALDGAVLMVSAVDGLRPYGELLEETLSRNRLPYIVFINQCDRPTADVPQVLRQLQKRLHAVPVPLPEGWFEANPDADAPEETAEALSDADDEAADRYLSEGCLSCREVTERLAALTLENRAVPVFQGSAAKDKGLEGLLDGILRFLPAPPEPADGALSGIVFGVESDKQLGRAAHVRLFSGHLSPRDALPFREETVKITAIRTLQPQGRRDLDGLSAGDVGVVYGLTGCRVGDILGDPVLLPRDLTPGKLAEPLLMTQVIPESEDALPALRKALDELTAEDPLMRMHWSSLTRQLTLDIMGTIQLEVLSVILPERFGLKVTFGQPKVVYKETVTGPAEGLAVYTMPKPCWAILKFLVEPLPTGSGVQYECAAPPAHLPYRYRRQVEQTVPRALRQGMMGWEVTDVKLTLIDGQDHSIHTHPLDFVLATPWAIMEALKNAGTQLLEPMLRCRISVPEDLVGRVMNEITLMRGEAGYPVSEDGAAVLTARIPAATSMDWPARLASMTQGRATLATRFDGYRPCPNELGESCPRRSVSPLDRMKYILAMRNALEGGLRDEF